MHGRRADRSFCPRALRFAAGFYRGLAVGKDYHTAFELGGHEIATMRLPRDGSPSSRAGWHGFVG